jgi:hypothetical protein
VGSWDHRGRCAGSSEEGLAAAARAQRRTKGQAPLAKGNLRMISERHPASDWTTRVMVRSHSLPRFRTRPRMRRYPSKPGPGSSSHHPEGNKFLHLRQFGRFCGQWQSALLQLSNASGPAHRTRRRHPATSPVRSYGAVTRRILSTPSRT